jgi:hypothetical protein
MTGMKRIAVALALTLAAAGCGGSKDKETTAASGTSTASTPAATATTAPQNVQNCQQILQLRTQVTQALANPNGIDTSMPKSLSDLAKSAPAEIRPDAEKIAAAYGTIVRAMDQADVTASSTPDPNALTRLAKVIDSLNKPELTAATQHVSAWVTANCK